MGEIHLVAIYNDALTLQQVQQNFASGADPGDGGEGTNNNVPMHPIIVEFPGFTVTESVSTPLNFSAVNLVQIGSGSGTVTVIVSSFNGGSLTATGGGGVIVGGSGNATLLLTGTSANIETFLDNTSAVRYVSPAGALGNQADTIALALLTGGTGAGHHVGMAAVDVLPGSNPGSVFYVHKSHPQSSDLNPGTESLPWKTIRHAANVVQAGETVYVKGDGATYTESSSQEGWNTPTLNPAHSGTPGNPITFRAYPGHRVTIVNAHPFNPVLGTSGRDYIIWEGFYSDQAALWNTTGSELGYLEISTTYYNPIGQSIHAAVITQKAENSRIHHSEFHGFDGLNQNSAGIVAWQMEAANLVIEDNYFHGNRVGVYDKDSAVNTIYRRNWMTDNVSASIFGNNQNEDASFDIYDNVLDNGVYMFIRNSGTKIHDNLIRPTAVDPYLTWTQSDTVGTIKNLHVWNNIVQHADPVGWRQEWARLGNELAYFNHNIYTGAPEYTFANETRNMSGMRSLGFETNSQPSVSWTNIYTTAWGLKAPYITAGRFGDAVGPGNGSDGLINQILDTDRYGPAAFALQHTTLDENEDQDQGADGGSPSTAVTEADEPGGDSPIGTLVAPPGGFELLGDVPDYQSTAQDPPPPPPLVEMQVFEQHQQEGTLGAQAPEDEAMESLARDLDGDWRLWQLGPAVDSLTADLVRLI
jgi:hypothetical protein